MPEDLKELLRAFNDQAVKFLVVGGYAFGVHAEPRATKDGTTFQIGQPPARIDILQHIDGVTFDEAWENRIEGIIDGQIQAAVISRDDLIRNKLATGREQDILDVKKLQTAKQRGFT